MRLYLAYRTTDASGFAFSLQRELKRLAPDATVVAAPAESSPPPAEQADIVLLLVGSRWLRPSPEEPPYLANKSDRIRRLLEDSAASRTIIPLLFQVPESEWSLMCATLPSQLTWLARLDATEIQADHFTERVSFIVDSLRSPRQNVPWTEAPRRTLIRFHTESGGVVKWWFDRETRYRIVLDDNEIGAVDGWKGNLDVDVKPGRHIVQVRQGPLFKSHPLTVEIAPGATVEMLCARNSFTGTVSLSRRA